MMDIPADTYSSSVSIIDIPSDTHSSRKSHNCEDRLISEGFQQDRSLFHFIYSPISYQDFYLKYILNNSACIISTGAIESWEAREKWSKNGEPCLEEMVNSYGTWLVPVANCSEKYFDSQTKSQKTLQDYVKYMKQKDRRGCLYLKDWHFHGEQRRRLPDQEAVYRTPALLASDWLNEYWEARPHRRDDYRFVYIGVAGTWTPFHADVFRSFSWSANVCGRKRWLLLPPGEERQLRSLSGLPYDVASVLGAESAAAAVSAADMSAGNDVTASLRPLRSPGGVLYYDVIQNEGEIMFVPSGWYHQVWNMRDTISINHNWFNGGNVGAVADFLLASLQQVKAELADIADDSAEWLAQCQTLLKATHGMDVAELCDLLCFTAGRRLTAVAGGTAVEGLDGWLYSGQHVVADLRAARPVLSRLLTLPEMERLAELRPWRDQVTAVLQQMDAVC